MKLWHLRFWFCLVIIIWGGIPVLFIYSENSQATDQLPTSVEVLVACGDGFAEPGLEICDPGDPALGALPDVGTTTCSEYNDIFANPFISGDMTCLLDCSDFDPSGCYTCGNGNKESAEQCEGSDFGGQTCQTYGYESGILTCTPNCLINLESCIPYTQEGGTPPGAASSGGGAGAASGFLPGSDVERVTKVIAIGKSYPHSDVHILLDGKVIGVVNTDAKADFYFETTDITPGVAGFGFWSEDKNGLQSSLLTLTIRVISNAVTTISGIYLSPTIDVDKRAVKQGEPIMIFGQTAPETEVNVHVHSEAELIESTDSTEGGDWSLVFDTSPLEEDFHTAKALFQIEIEGNIIRSGFSRVISFYVGSEAEAEICAGADLNGDGRVNLTDFSILLYWWGTDDECADQNKDGTVDLIDFSIMMYYWTG